MSSGSTFSRPAGAPNTAVIFVSEKTAPTVVRSAIGRLSEIIETRFVDGVLDEALQDEAAVDVAVFVMVVGRDRADVEHCLHILPHLYAARIIVFLDRRLEAGSEPQAIEINFDNFDAEAIAAQLR